MAAKVLGPCALDGRACRDRLVRTVVAMSMPSFVQKHGLTGVTALLFGLTLWRLGVSPELPAVLAFIFGGVLLSVIDWKVQRLPTRLVYLTLAAVAAGLLFASLVEWDWVPLATALAGAALYCSDGRGGLLLLSAGECRHQSDAAGRKSDPRSSGRGHSRQRVRHC